MVRLSKSSDLIEIIGDIINSNSTKRVHYVTLLTLENFKDQEMEDFSRTLLMELSKSKGIMKMN